MSYTITQWLSEISAAKSREKRWQETATKVVELYEGYKEETAPFNILYSNTETLQPAVYNSTPRPVVKRRFDDKDPLGKVCCDVVTRALKYQLDDGMGGEATFDDLLKGAVVSGLVPGRGVTWFKYSPVIKTKMAEPATESAEEEATEPQTVETLEGESVIGEDIPFNRFLHGYAKTWADVPWVARLWFMDQEELVSNFGADKAALVQPKASAEENLDKSEGAKEEQKDPNRKTAPVYEIWCKEDKTVYFVSPDAPDDFLKSVEDPLGLTGFFPCPEPLKFVTKLSSLVPQCPYLFYKKQAEELNAVTNRITKLVEALKLRGFYDSTLENLDNLMKAEDNTLLAASQVSTLQQGQTLDKSIWFFPIKDLVPVLQQLYTQRAQIKQVIYEITGIADIMRGASSASETLGAQEIKQQWGTLRLKKAQKAVMYYARDCLRIMAEITCSKMSSDSLQKITGLRFPTALQKEQARQTVQQFAAMGQQPPPDLAAMLQQPSWEDILQLLKDDLQRSFRIEIETNSTIDAEASEDKQDIGELLNAMAQFLNGIAPLIQSGAMPFDVAKGILLTIVRRYQFGPELEDQISQMQPPQPPEDPQKAVRDAELQLKQLELEAAKRKDAAEAARTQQDAEFQTASHQQRMAEQQMRGNLAARQHQYNLEKLALQAIADKAKAQQAARNPSKQGK